MKRDLGAHPIQLTRLMDGVTEGAVVLPEFQRDYDWNSNDVRSLLATVLMGWPSGSLLLMDGAPDFALRSLEGAPAKSGHVEYVVLDGQQRLTALFHALRGFGDQSWVLRTQALPSRLADSTVDDIEEALEPIERSRWDVDYPLSRQAREGLIPLGTLTSPTDYFDWRDSVVETESSPIRAKELRAELTNAYKELLGRVHDYAYPAVVLQPQLEVEAIARIFERINRTGLRLTTFDLMVARTYTPSWNLRDEWDAAVELWPLLGDFMSDGLMALQIVALRDSGDIRQPAVLKMTPDTVQAEFAIACEGLASALDWLVASCGVRKAEWLPYGVMPVVLGALAVNAPLAEAGESLPRWFWLSVITQRYDVASSTQAATDYGALLQRRPPSFASLTDGVVSVAAPTLLDATRRKAGAFWRGFLCALASVDLEDPVTGESLIEPESGLLGRRGGTASIFPRSGAIPGRSPTHLLVLGVFIGAPGTRRQLSGDVAEWTDATLSENALASQLLPDLDELRRLVLDPSRLVRVRLGLLCEFVAERTGVEIQLS